MRRKALAFTLLFAASPALASADAAGFENLDKLEARLVGALDADIGQPGGPATHIDRRLKLAPCPSPATIDPPALGAVALRCEQIGWRIRVPLMHVPLPQGAAVGAPSGAQFLAQPAQPQSPPLIKRGDPVQLVSGTETFTVSTAAVAQEDGRLGGRIRVKPQTRGEIVIGQVVDTGLVRIAAF